MFGPLFTLPFSFLFFFFSFLFLFFFFFHVLPLLATFVGIGTLECLTVPTFGPISFSIKDIRQPNCTTEPENGHCLQHNDLGLKSLTRQTYDVSF
jgi:hypothetical protein